MLCHTCWAARKNSIRSLLVPMVLSCSTGVRGGGKERGGVGKGRGCGEGGSGKSNSRSVTNMTHGVDPCLYITHGLTLAYLHYYAVPPDYPRPMRSK